MRAVRFSVVTAVATAAALTAVTGCAEKSDGKGDGAVKVTAKDDSCAVSKKTLPAGHVALAVENKGSKVTEVYVLFPDDRIVAERENIGPGTKATITAEVKAGSYDVVCKPGMKGSRLPAEDRGHRRHRGQAQPRDGQGRRRLPHLCAGAGR